MKINFCSYFDIKYLSKFLVLKNSIDIFSLNYNHFVLALDEYVEDFFKRKKFKNIEVIKLKDLEQEYKDLITAKNNRELIEYYFTLSPFLPKYIFEKFKLNNIFYVDSDFFFYKNPKHLFLQNNNDSITLIRQLSDPKYGLFNMGLIHYNFNFNETAEVINTWSHQCLNYCSDTPDLKKNTYADQKYLDEWIVKLKNIKVLYPEYSVLSPWDSNESIENNIDNIFAFHFHGFQTESKYFISGFSNYNKRLSKLILKNIYVPYAKKIFTVKKKYNLEDSSIRNFSKKKIIKIRKIRTYIKRFIFRDRYSTNLNNNFL